MEAAVLDTESLAEVAKKSFQNDVGNFPVINRLMGEFGPNKPPRREVQKGTEEPS